LTTWGCDADASAIDLAQKGCKEGAKTGQGLREKRPNLF